MRGIQDDQGGTPWLPFCSQLPLWQGVLLRGLIFIHFHSYNWIFQPTSQERMDSLIGILCDYAPYAHLIIFTLLLLAGLCLPISEDVLLITGGAIASLCIPEQKFHLFAWIFAGSWISAWEVYWIGRLLGPRLYDIKFFNRYITPKRIDKLQHYYEKFGIFTFIIGRFFPGGVRNALFLSSGLGKMPFLKFMARDGLACLISTSTIFSLGFIFAANYQQIVKTLEKYEFIALAIITICTLALLTFFYFRKNKPQDNP